MSPIPESTWRVLRILPHFAGCATAEKRLVLPIKAFIDESGAENTDKVFVLAGFLGRAEQWADFSLDWQRCLHEFPSIDFFHMVDAASLSGQFSNWKRATRDAKLRALIAVIKKHANVPDGIWGIYFTIPFEAFRKHVIHDLSKPVSAVYLWGLFLILTGIQHDLELRGITEEFEPIFDRNDTFGRKANILYPLIRDGIGGKLEIALPPQIQFGDDRKFEGLQAADLLAWLLRRSWNGKADFDWTLDDLWIPIRVSDQSLRLCEHNIDFLAKMKGWHESLPIPEDVIKKWMDEVGYADMNKFLKKRKADRGHTKQNAE